MKKKPAKLTVKTKRARARVKAKTAKKPTTNPRKIGEVNAIKPKPGLTDLQKLELRLDEERERPWAHLKGFKPLKPGEKQIDDLDEDPDDRLSVIEQRLLQFCDRMGGFHLRLNKWGWRV